MMKDGKINSSAIKNHEENGPGKNINELQVYQTPSRQIYNSIEKNRPQIQMTQ